MYLNNYIYTVNFGPTNSVKVLQSRLELHVLLAQHAIYLSIT